jgi:hypothetical protein
MNPRWHAWALDVRRGTVHSKSAGFCARIAAQGPTFPVWATSETSPTNEQGIFYVMGNHPTNLATCTGYCGESDVSVPAPFPAVSLGDPYDCYTATGGDDQFFFIDIESGKSYEVSGGVGGPLHWSYQSYAVFDFNSEIFTKKAAGMVPGETPSTIGAYRSVGWTSTDAAGLSQPPGLLKVEEVAEGEIRHALRFTTPNVAAYYVHPASHIVGTTDDSYDPPMGLRLRLKQSININQLLPDDGTRDRRIARIILRGMQKYGIINADIGSGTGLMRSPTYHTELKWPDYMSSGGAFASQMYMLQGRGQLSIADDFEVVDWTWQYKQYAHYDSLYFNR